ncbi:hypothetical protein ACOMHN_022746 [Nucella lapillus]
MTSSTSLFCLLALMSAYGRAMPSKQCEQGVSCQMPDCFCPTLDHPSLVPQDIPQMVYFGFDDALTGEVDKFYQQLFNSKRRNPNGCPITMSLYVQNDWTIYDLVSSHFQYGDEIGSHSVTHTNVRTKEAMILEAGGQKDNIVLEGQVPADQVLGWRSPNLAPAGDAQVEVLQRFNYTYDISLTYTRASASEKVAWPFTLDFGYQYRCAVPKCPSKNHPGFWQVPVNSMYNPQTGYPCVYVDACRPTSEQAAFDYLMSNFRHVYNSNRAPFGLNMHASWFFTPMYLKATHRFLDHLQSLNDVYVISVKQVLEWMRNPVKVSEVQTLPGWGCQTPVNRTTITTTTTTTTSTTTTSSANTATPSLHASSNTTVVTSFGPPEPQVCMQVVNCHLPHCQCRSVLPPAGLSPAQTPQIIYLTVMESVNFMGHALLKNVLTRRNPNGCPISATFFVPPSRFLSQFVQDLRGDGHEVALYGSDVTGAAEQVPTIMHPDNMQGLSQRAGGINLGYRAPRNSPNDDKLFGLLNASDILYDSSLVASRDMSLQTHLPWPYTLDFGAKESCDLRTPCPKERYSGLWEVPIIPMVDYKKTLDARFACTFADTCFYQPPTAKATEQFFQQNLENALNTNRAPMGINLRRLWFSHSVYAPNRQGLMNFLDSVLRRGDVYVMSVEKMLNWMRNPTSFDQMASLNCQQ